MRAPVYDVSTETETLDAPVTFVPPPVTLSIHFCEQPRKLDADGHECVFGPPTDMDPLENGIFHLCERGRSRRLVKMDGGG